MSLEPQTVYVVEDDEAARHSAEALLETMGYRVRAFGSCEEFLAQLDPENTGYLLLDYRFDGISGLELLEELRRRGIPCRPSCLPAYSTQLSSVARGPTIRLWLSCTSPRVEHRCEAH